MASLLLPHGQQCPSLSDAPASLGPLPAEPDWYAALATTSSMLHDGFEYFSWTGFYRRLGPGSRSATPRSSNGKGSSPRGEDDCTLIIGPYQGSLGCLRIPHGRGVCGAAAVTRSTQLVDDVRTFPGYIACTGRYVLAAAA